MADSNKDSKISWVEFKIANDAVKSLIKTKPKADEMRQKPTNDLDKLFNKIDTSMDSKLSQSEVQNYMLSNAFTFNASDITNFWHLADNNKDGFLTLEEVKKAMSKDQGDNLSLAYDKNQKVNLVFGYYDANKDNFLDVTEVQKILKDAYGMGNIEDAQWFLGQLDSNFDQKLDWNEVAAVVQ